MLILKAVLQENQTKYFWFFARTIHVRIDHGPNIPSTHIWNGRMSALCSAHGRHVKIDKNHATHGDALLPGPWERLTVHVQNGNSVEEAYQIIRNNSVEQPSYKFKDEQFDCDDFAYLLKAEFAKTAYNDNVHNAPWAVGIIFNQSHAYNWMINDDFVMRLIEPQTDKIYYPGAGDIDVNFIAT